MKGVLEADFSSFVAACKSAEVSLDGLEKGSKNVAKSLNTAAESFSGGKIIQQAQIAMRAVDEIGGVTKLTQKEQAKLNGLVTEAIAKYDALGKAAPADMKALADQTKGAADQLKAAQGTNGVGGMTAGLKSMAAVAGVAFSVDAAIAFGKHIVSNAAAIKDQAEALGVSIEGFQKFKAAAEEGGATIDDVGKAINTMNKNIDEGNKTTVDSLKALGLSYKQVSTLSPEDAFLAITDALQKLEDPMQQARIGSDLLGNSFVKLAPAIKDGVRDAGNAATIMSEDTVRDLAEAEAAWGRLSNWVTIQSGKILASVLSVTKEATSSWSDFFLFVDNSIKSGSFAAGAAMTQVMIDAKRAAAKAAEPPPAPAGPPKKTKEEIDAEARAHDKATAAIEAHQAAIKALSDAYSGATSIKAATNALEALAKSGMTVEKMTVAQQKALASTMNEALAAYKAAGTEAPPAIQNIATAISNLADQQGRYANLLAQAQAHEAAELKLSETNWQAWQNTVSNALQSIPTRLVGIRNLSSIAPMIGAAAATGGNLAGKTNLGPGLLEQIIGDPAALGAKISGAIAGAIQGGGNIAGAAAGAMGSSLGTNIAGKLSKSLVDTGSGMFSKALGGVISSALPIVGSLIGPLADMLWDGLFGTKGRDAVKKFADSFGGFDDLHAQLLKVGAAGEEMWKKLTQQTGKNDAEAAARNIKAAQDLIASAPSTMAAAAGYKTKAELQTLADESKKVYEFMKSSGEYTAAALAAAFTAMSDAQQAALGETATAAGEAATKALDDARGAIAKLDEEINSLNESIKDEAPEEVMGIVEQQARARIDALTEERTKAQAGLDEMITASATKTDEGLDTIDDGLADNADAWKSWADKASDEIDRVASKLGGLPAPGVPGGVSSGGGAAVPSFANGTGGQYLNFGRGTLAMLHGRERVSRPGEDSGGGGGTAIIQIDGRTFAEIVVPHIPGVVTRYGLG